ncbi:Elongation factor P--(R)-beta-lysine ligase [Candidatus Erwinia haradaeae]|uniref:Elongation factor P--(R)-beta-lysine ligase n=1 Tax=Candidatus Erwinia haradaeae TaxID=1922217 RepID=A0A451CZG7_9GAMM|nr:elongation factor P--(R)-beta-lysine ligase [Candidatus Erwinia haradaeae]VFP78796.1 Elongation factor P--(R)-beta-lysine ligase [Candidatus Erwinia haradaeae]
MNNKNDWRPSASLHNLIQRSITIKKIRHFFSKQNILEVETPSMSKYTVTDVHLSPFQTHFKPPGWTKQKNKLRLWLITSPEYHMKRLLAAGSGAIYQLSRSFRNEEMGRYHNPEFTILEWYQPGYDMHHLMHEVDQLLQFILDCKPAEFLSYQEAFLRYLKIDPLLENINNLSKAAKTLGASHFTQNNANRNALLQLLFTNGIENKIGQEKPIFIYNFPADQAGLAVISSKDFRVAERFEVYFKGIELANGFRELTDSHEQQKRFEKDNKKRSSINLPTHPIDTYLLNALESGMPDCSGVAVGVDRLIMIALKANTLSEVIAFTKDRC